MNRAIRIVLGLLTTLALASAAGSALAQPAPAEKPTSFGADAPKAEGKPRTTEEALDRCVNDVRKLETDAIGVPYLAAGYIAFFAIPVVFLVLAGRRQRRLEAEMAELRERLAALQDAGAK